MIPIYHTYSKNLQIKYTKGVDIVDIIVHYPQTAEQQAVFDTRVNKFRAEYIVRYIERLNCSTEQKIELIDAVIDTVRGGTAV